MQALIPVAGVGTRLRPHTYTQPKPLIPVAGKPIIGFIIDELLEVGINDFIFVIGYLGERIQQYIEEYYPDIQKTFIQQSTRLGSGHAVWMAREVINPNEELLIVFGDTIFDLDWEELKNEKKSCLGIKKVADPREFGVAEVVDGFVVSVIEKPQIPLSNKALVGLYKITEVDELLEAVNIMVENDLRSHEEFQLTDAIQTMIKRGVKFKGLEVNNWFDCGRKDILLETNAMLLKKVKEQATLNRHTRLINTIIVPPVFIGQDCKINNSVIGPYVSIGNGAQINHSVLKNSIIGSYAFIDEVVLKKSIIGNDASIKGLSQSLNIGDDTEIDFS
ncbi:MAG: sugar phosphate nucleotidyltransferase [Saprospiraceae bacterium]